MFRPMFSLVAVLVIAVPVVAGDAPDVERRFKLNDNARIGGGITINVDGDGNWNLELPKANLTIGRLVFPKPCKVTVLKKDMTLLAQIEGLTAKDDSGKTWKSRQVILDGKDLIAFFQEK
jgi:hypothetical protein